MAAGLLYLALLLPLAGQLDALFGLDGWFDRRAYAEAARLPDGPPRPLTWSVLYLCGSDPVRLRVAYGVALGAVALLTVGVWTRLTAPLVWVAVASFTANPATAYGPDHLLVILAFYLMVGYLLRGWWRPGLSTPQRLLGGRDDLLLGGASAGAARAPSVAANLALRLLQVHWAVLIVAGALHKLQSGLWWSGVALWFPLYPPFETAVAEVRALAPHAGGYLFALSLAGYATLAWQLAFPLFAWRRQWRVLLLGGAAVGWLWAACVEGLPLAGPALFIGCLSYLTGEEWQRAAVWVTRLRARVKGTGWRAAPRGSFNGVGATPVATSRHP
jgi:hypothetical protein